MQLQNPFLGQDCDGNDGADSLDCNVDDDDDRNGSGDHDADDEQEFVQKLSAGAGSSSFGKNALGISSNSLHF